MTHDTRVGVESRRNPRPRSLVVFFLQVIYFATYAHMTISNGHRQGIDSFVSQPLMNRNEETVVTLFSRPNLCQLVYPLTQCEGLIFIFQAFFCSLHLPTAVHENRFFHLTNTHFLFLLFLVPVQHTKLLVLNVFENVLCTRTCGLLCE